MTPSENFFELRRRDLSGDNLEMPAGPCHALAPFNQPCELVQSLHLRDDGRDRRRDEERHGPRRQPDRRRALQQLHERGRRSRPPTPSRWPATWPGIRKAATTRRSPRVADGQRPSAGSAAPSSALRWRRRQGPEKVHGLCSARAAWACRTATITWRPASRPRRPPTEAYIAQVLTLAGWPEPPRRPPRPSWPWKPGSPTSPGPGPSSRDDDKTYNPFDRSPSSKPNARRASPGSRSWATAPASTRLARWSSENRPPSRRSPPSTPKPRSTTLKAWSAFQHADQAAPYLSKRFDQAHYEFHNKDAAGAARAAARWKRGVAPGQRLARRGARQALCRRLLPAGGEGQDRKPWSATPARAMKARASSKLDWMRPGNQDQGPGEAGQVPGEDRLSRQMARRIRA